MQDASNCNGSRSFGQRTMKCHSTASLTMCRIPGGSSANVIKALANLTNGRIDLDASFLGMIGKDETGQDYKRRLQEQGVDPQLLVRSV